MPRPLVYSNGSLFVGIDERGRIRDLFYPHVGLYNHLSGRAIRVGVWTGGRFSWLEDDGWSRRLGYEPGSLVGDSAFRNDFLGLELTIREWVEPVQPIFHRTLAVRDLSGSDREVRLFFAHDLQIAETDIGDTALFQPFLNGIVHYKGPHYFLFTAEAGGRGIDEYACGTVGPGLEGTWRDAEDGHLSLNPISQGSVDSAMGLRIDLKAGTTEIVAYRIAAAGTMGGLEAFDAAPPRSEGRAAADREALESLASALSGLPETVIQVARRSLLLIEAMCDREGAILAATDSDIMETARANYCYTWPRDAAHVCRVLTRLGRYEPVRRFLRFAKGLAVPDRPFLLQKYRPDGTLGATWHPWVTDGMPEVPHQEDESASTLVAAAQYLAASGDQPLRDELNEPLLRPLAGHLAEFRDPATGLPLPSYDLWEERRGVHAYTCATVFEGLNAAADLASTAGGSEAHRYRAAAEEVRAGVQEHMRGPHGNFARRLEVDANGRAAPDDAPDASTLWLGLSGLIDPKDPLFEIHMRAVWEALWVSGPVGGLARYQDDYYFRANHDVPGNPWIITTLWLAQCLICRAETEVDLSEPLEMLVWAAHYAGPTGVLPEQLHPMTGEPLSVSPLTWSHAEFLKTALDWAEKRGSMAG